MRWSLTATRKPFGSSFRAIVRSTGTVKTARTRTSIRTRTPRRSSAVRLRAGALEVSDQMHPSRARPGRPRAREEAAALTLATNHLPALYSKLGALAAYLLRARPEVERDQAYPAPPAMAHDGPLLTQQPAQPLTPTTAQRNGAMGRRSRASGFDSPGGHRAELVEPTTGMENRCRAATGPKPETVGSIPTPPIGWRPTP